jgi:hypothetical protein
VPCVLARHGINWRRYAGRPNTVEAVRVRVEQFTAVEPPSMKDRGMCRRESEDMSVDEHLLIESDRWSCRAWFGEIEQLRWVLRAATGRRRARSYFPGHGSANGAAYGRLVADWSTGRCPGRR